MPGPFDSTPNIPWLNNNPAQFLIDSERAGAAYGQLFAQGMQIGNKDRQDKADLAEKQREFDVSTQEHSREFNITAQQQQQRVDIEKGVGEMKVKEAQADINTTIGKQASNLKTKEGNAALAGVNATIAQTPGGWTAPESKKLFWETARQFPDVMETPEFRDMAKRFDFADHAATQKEALDAKQAMAADALASKEGIAASNNQTKTDIANSRFGTVANSMDKNGRIISESEFINRHLNEMMTSTGVNADKAAVDLRDVYRKHVAPGIEALRNQGKNGGGEMVPMMSPDGKVGKVPKSNLDNALKQGFTLAQ